MVRTPFLKLSNSRQLGNICYFGFDSFSKAQKFARYLSGLGYTFQLRQGQMLQDPYEIKLQGHADLARTLAGWERGSQKSAANRSLGKPDKKLNLVPRPVPFNSTAA